MDFSQIGLGLLLSTLIGGLAYWRRSLSVSGWVGAVIVGTLTFGFGGLSWGISLIAFFISSSLLSHYKERIKEQRAAEKFAKGGRRDLAQTLANGGIGALLALGYGLAGQPELLLGLFVGVMATVTADTWATELGVLSQRPPRLITSGRVVEPGTSGGISLVGTAASCCGAIFIGLVFWVNTALFEGATSPLIVPAATFGGLLGALSDSLLGATLQAIYHDPHGRETEHTHTRDGQPNQLVRGLAWLNNDLVNLCASLIGGLVTAAILLVSGQ